MQGYHLKVASISKNHYSKSRMYCNLNAQGPQVQYHQRIRVYTLYITILLCEYEIKGTVGGVPLESYVFIYFIAGSIKLTGSCCCVNTGIKSIAAS